MRCLACDAELSDKEAVRKYADTQHYVDLCNHCFGTVREDILSFEDEDGHDTEEMVNA